MKKIVSAALVGAMVAGAFAADLTVKSEIKFQPMVAQWNLGDTASTHSYATIPNVKDTVTIQLQQDNVTVFGKFDAQNSGITVNSAYSKLNWGNFNLWAMRNDSRFSNRVNKDQNDLSLIEQNYAVNFANSSGVTTDQVVPGAKKLGVNANLFSKPWSVKKNNKSGVDVDNIGAITGSKADAFVIDYTLVDVIPGKLLLKGAVKQKANAWTGTSDDTTVTNNAAYSFEAGYTHDAFVADFVVNLDQKDAGSLGFFVSPVVEGLTSVFGFTYGWDKSTVNTDASVTYVNGDGKTSAKDYYEVGGNGKKLGKDDTMEVGSVYYKETPAKTTEWDNTFIALDLRARYAITEELAAGIYANWTGYKIKYSENGKVKLDNDMKNALDVVLNVNYKLSDLAKVFVEGELSAISLDSDDMDLYGMDIVPQAGFILTPAKGATLVTAVRAIIPGVGAKDRADSFGTTIAIPVSFKCSL